MTDKEIEAIQQSFLRVFPRKSRLSRRFLEILFEREPKLRPLFTSEVTHTFERVIMILASIVKALGNDAAVAKVIDPLAKRHTTRPVRAEYFPVVGEALIASMDETAEPSLTEEEVAAWAKAWALLSEMMIERIEAEREARGIEPMPHFASSGR